MSVISYQDFPRLNKSLVDRQEQNSLKRYIDRRSEREHIASKLSTQSPLEVDTSYRVAIRKTLINPRDGLSMKRIIGESDLFPISYLEAGLKAGKSVCRIEIRDSIGRVLGHGTGFLVAPSLLLTNHHVLDSASVARSSLAQFNCEVDLNLMPRQIKSFRFVPERLFITDVKLDFTLVALETDSADGTKLSEFGFLPLYMESGKALLGEYVSSIQHPSGAPKVVAIRENRITDIFDDFINYTTDTMPGSSGSPVFNDEWVTIALHHTGVPDPDDSTKYIANEGIRISSIMECITLLRPTLHEEQQVLLDSLFASSGLPYIERSQMIIGNLAIDWYERSTGYNTAFLGNHYAVPLPELRSDLKQDIALLKNGTTVLDYTHFSIVMSKSRRLAYYTAVNINGQQLINIQRPKKWYFDPRIDRKYQCGPELYDNNDIDRGHLVRRLDPIWGKLAKKANEDTFHFTNCSPQHKNFNQLTWLDLENYILKNAETFDLKVTVFTGPVFRTDDMLYRGVKIPAEFWKIAVMVKEDGNMSATAYLQTQKNLIRDLDFAFGSYKTYQVAVSNIEILTGLDFGDLRNHDPLRSITEVADDTESAIVNVINTPSDIRI
ncbi:DNA/RNA non-specific endonuclease [Pelosinus baikalensis]|uniref:DNA/RNA non-specific endonuclease n=1 Tax=Pelosinus baikalensis TaxID=2892015 RepID=A0ABS8HR78_9FIRM|nr:DNA/RNA non-specific endonuclease [Pelosinus baikalensis]MCC5465680.1 DNA/RNA non-specific endonuclease [Pelosinus baikalensis]